MKRDFTIKNYEYFCKLSKDLQVSGWLSGFDTITDMYYDIKHLLCDLGLGDKMSDMDRYHREVIDKENTSIDTITAIFEKVSYVDKKYAKNSSGDFAKCYETAVAYKNFMVSLNQLSADACAACWDGGKLSDYFNKEKIENIMSDVETTLQGELEELMFTADTFGTVDNDYKDEYIKKYELENPKEVKHIDSIFKDKDFSEQDIRDIKFLIYNAPEPYKSIYLEHVKDYKVQLYSNNEHDGSFYTTVSNEIYIRDDSNTMRDNPRGPYNTFFHESGHAIDDFEKTCGDLTGSYKYDGKMLNDIIEEDVRDYVSDYIDERWPNLSEDQKTQLMKSLNLSDDSSFRYGGERDSLPAALQSYRDTLVGEMYTDLKGPLNEAASDVFGGVTNNAIIGDYGHCKDPNDKKYNYWYNGTKPTGSQESELWAEFFAAKMTNDETALESIKKHFPTAYKAMEEMAWKMVNN